MRIPKSSNLPTIKPSDVVLQKRVLRAFWIKTQNPELLKPNSMYRHLAINILEIAAEKEYDAEQLEAACKRFEKTQQFGDRIETANFFNDDSEQLYPYVWYLEQLSKGFKGKDFDAYKLPGVEKPMWRMHDGTKIPSLDCIIFAGVHQVANPTENTPQPKQPLLPITTGDAVESLGNQNLKLQFEVQTLRSELAKSQAKVREYEERENKRAAAAYIAILGQEPKGSTNRE